MGNAAEFKPENYYEIPGVTVSDEGDVFDSTGEKMKTVKKEGYEYVRVIINGKEKLCKVHRIVACSFQDICGEFNQVVNHLDEDKSNNKASNLKWTSTRENNTWGTVIERRKETIKRKSVAKELFIEYCAKNSTVHYPSGIKVKKLKYGYKVTSKDANESLFMLYKDVEKRISGESEPMEKSNEKLITPGNVIHGEEFNFDAYYRDYMWICHLFDRMDKGEL